MSNLVGIDERMRKIESLLEMESQEVRVVGIWGMGGIGKTTIAKAVYNKVCSEFEAFDFVPNLRDELNRRTVADLQRSFVSRLLDQEILDMGWLSFGNHFIKAGLRRKKVLLVLDDVDSSMLSKELLEGLHDSFGSGSRILVTGRDQHVLNQVVDATYEVEPLNYAEALQLFKSKAFKRINPTSYLEDLLQRMINYTKGNPLALDVLGSTLCDRSKEDWNSVLNGLGKCQDDGILKVLRISYDGLNEERKSIFLDVAYCFIYKNRWDVENILEKKSPSVHRIISDLIDKSLITTSNNTLGMHDLLREMAYSIGQEESENPGKRRRLHDPEDICWVLKKKKGTETVKCISLHMRESMKLQLEPDSFAGMDCLEFLIFKGYYTSNVCLPHCGLNYLPDMLRYINWNRFASKSLPQNFCAENLVEFDFSESKFEKLWSGQQDLANLRRVNLSSCGCLTELPDLSKANRLQYVLLVACDSLIEVPSCFEYFEFLEYLYVGHCSNLKYFPRRIGSNNLKTLSLDHCSNIKKCPKVSADIEDLYLSETAIEELQPSFFNKEASLDLSGCSNITKFPEILGYLKGLYLSGTSIEEVPSSIRHLTNLIVLYLDNGKQLSRLPSSICKLKSLQQLSIRNCSKLESFPEIMEPMESLVFLNLGKSAIRELHSSIQFLTNLQRLRMDNCKKLSRLPSSICKLRSLSHLDLFGCSTLESFPEIMEPMESLTELDLSGTAIRGLHSSIQFLTILQQLRMDHCKNLSTLPSSIRKLRSLKYLHVSGCSKLESIQEITESMESLEVLNLAYTAIRELPSSIMLLKSLKQLHLDGTLIKELSELPPSLEILTANDCESLEIMSTSTLGDSHSQFCFSDCFKIDHKALMEEMLLKIQFGKIRQKYYDFQMELPGSEIPEWFSDQSMGSSITVRLPSNPRLKLQAIAFCLVFVDPPYEPDVTYGLRWVWQAKINNGEYVIYTYSGASFPTIKSPEKDHMYLFCHDMASVAQLGFADFSKYLGREIMFEFNRTVAFCTMDTLKQRRLFNLLFHEKPVEVKRFGIHLLFDENTDQPSSSSEDDR